MRFFETVAFEILCVRGCEVKSRRHVTTQSENSQLINSLNLLDVWAFALILKHCLLPSQFTQLLFRVSQLVGRITLKRQWINWILRTLFDKDVFLSVVPVWEASHVWTHCNNRFWCLLNSAINLVCRQSLTSNEGCSSGCLVFHAMRIYDFCFFFEIKSIFMAFNAILRRFIWIILFVVRKQLWIGVTNESVCASCFTNTVVSSW